MKNLRALLILVVLGAFAFCVPEARAQGTKADYERALSLPRRTSGKVLNQSLAPNWLPDGNAFWYRRETGAETHEFIFVDALKGSREVAFDHARVAASLAKVAGREVRADTLPIEKIEFVDGAAAMEFRAFGKNWRCVRATGEVSEAPARNGSEKPASATRTTRPTNRSNGEETSLVFINQTDGPVSIWWIDPAGARHSYGKLAALERRDQHTFVGHVWVVEDAKGKRIATFEGGAQGAEAVIRAEGQEVREKPKAVQRGRSPDTSPDGRWQAFIRNDNVFIRLIETKEEFALSAGGKAEDFFEARFHWSPDSRRLVVRQIVKGEEHKIHLVESSPADRVEPKLHELSYTKPGDKIAHPRPRLFDVAERRAIAVAEELFPNPYALDDVRWSPDSKWFSLTYNQRGHQVYRIVAVDAATGAARALVNEACKTFFDYANKRFAQWLDESGELIWMSERDGWNHLYLYDTAAGRVKNQITRGEWVVRGVERVDAKARQIWLRACGVRARQDPYYVHLCRVNFDGSGFTVLTKGDGTHEWKFSPGEKFIVDTWSRVDQPPVHELRSATDGRLVCALERADAAAVLKAGWRFPERFVAKGRDGKTDIFGIIVRPSNFDPTKKYPVIEEIYAGPHGAFVPKAFARSPRQHAMAELGFIVVRIDGMGTNWRSKAFHDVAWKNLGDSGFPDRIAWMKAAAAKYPEMDLSRVGIFGGSAGGQSAARALFAFGDFYKAGVADCGCHDNRMDKIWWNELWMGWPVGPHYEAQSNVTNAKNLTGKLMLIVGELDKNVDPASTMQVANALIKADRDFDLLVVPGGGHGVAETPYAYRRRMDFFVRHLHGMEPRSR